MTHRRNLHQLSPSEWSRLDDELDRLLELDPTTRSSRLRELERTHPDDAQLLRELLDSEAQDQRLDLSLLSALSYLSGQSELEPGTRIGPWALVRLLGRGGMAEVYLAERADGAFEGQVALKLLWPGLVSDRSDQLVRQERQILASLTDPRIASLRDGGVTENGRPWLAMEHVEGCPITDDCRQRKLSLDHRLQRFIDVVDAVASAHRKLVIHGDIKPANVLVTESGQVKLLDFGIARLLGERPDASNSDASWEAHTPGYASPEQQHGQPLTPASDIYQLGRLLAKLVEDLPGSGRRRHREIQAIINQASAVDPEARYRSANHFLADLKALLDHRPVSALRAGPGYRLQCLLRRRWPAIGVSGILILVGSAMLTQQWIQARELARRHEANNAVLGFLEDLLQQSNPHQANGPALISGELLKQATEQLDERLGTLPTAQARMLNTLGQIHLARNELLLARQRHGEALALARRHGLDDALDRSLDGLASVGIWSGDYDRSEGLLRELLDRREQRGRSTPELSATRLKLADLLHSRGDYASALALSQAAVRSGHHEVWAGRVISMILRDQGHFDLAESHLLASLSLEQARQPPRLPRLAELSDHLTMLRLHQGRWNDAAQALAESSRLRRIFLGEDWQGLVWPRHWQSLHALASGDHVAAAELLDVVVADYQRFFGEESHLLAFARSDRGWVALAQGRITAASEDFEAAAEGLTRIGSTAVHPRLAEPLLGLSLIHLAQGQAVKARTQAERALALRDMLPADAAGARAWRSNACWILRLSGGQCRPASSDQNGGLDHQRLAQARAGLCRTVPRQIRLCQSD